MDKIQEQEQQNAVDLKQEPHRNLIGEELLITSGSHACPKGRLSTEDLATLIQRAGEGDQLALQALIVRYTRLIEQTLRRKLRQDSNDADIDELTNRVFYKMVQGLPSLKLDCCFKAWLMKIAERAAYSHLRALVRQRRIGKLPERNAEIAIDHQPSQEDEQEENDEGFQVHQHRSAQEYDKVIDRIDRERAACRFLSKLDHPLLRQIFNLTYAQHLRR
jgi:RNA polymerase sigma factor (sigma-70 family)